MSYGTTTQQGNTKHFSVRTSTDAKGRKQAVFALPAQQGEAGAKQVFDKDNAPVVDKEGKPRYRTEHNFIDGVIVALEQHEAEFNGKVLRFLNIVMMDKDECYSISIQRGDRYWVDFLKRLPGIDLSKPVRLSPYSIENDGKWNQGIVAQQDGKKVMSAFTRENNWGGMDNAVQVEFNGEMKWNYGPRDKWLEANVLLPAQAKLHDVASEGPVPALTAEPPHANDGGAEPEETDDLPF